MLTQRNSGCDDFLSGWAEPTLCEADQVIVRPVRQCGSASEAAFAYTMS